MSGQFLIEHKFLPHCWACETRFRNQYPPGPAEEERHHILPEAYGGKHGPQVSLCTDCHTKVHKLASAFRSNKEYGSLLIALPQDGQKKLMWLGQKANEMQTIFADDPNRRQVISAALDKEYQAKFDYIRNHLKLSKKDTVLRLIDVMYRHLSSKEVR